MNLGYRVLAVMQEATEKTGVLAAAAAAGTTATAAAGSKDFIHAAGNGRVWRDFLQLTKPTISLLVVVTALPSMFLASAEGQHKLNFILVFATLFGTWLASASAAVLNHLVDADIDSEMARTRARPVATGRVAPKTAFAFAGFLGVCSFCVLYHVATPLAAYLAVAANFFYVVIYTMYLKRRTVQNIVIGGAAGAAGPLIGWAAVTGQLSWQSWVLFGIICLWTPPHFWALAIKYKRDYAAAKIPMMPVVHGDDVTRRQMFLYTLTLIPAVLVLGVDPNVGWVYLTISGGLTGYFVFLAWRLFRSRDNRFTMPLFYYSCLYLFGVFGALAIDGFARQL